MAEVDTGLGWSAEEDWLINGAGVIANVLQIGSPDYPNQPLPYGVVSAALSINCVLLQHRTRRMYSCLDCLIHRGILSYPVILLATSRMLLAELLYIVAAGLL